VRSNTSATAPARTEIFDSPMRNDLIMVGIERISVMMPPVATAPAPI